MGAPLLGKRDGRQDERQQWEQAERARSLGYNLAEYRAMFGASLIMAVDADETRFASVKSLHASDDDGRARGGSHTRRNAVAQVRHQREARAQQFQCTAAVTEVSVIRRAEAPRRS
jgi:hypothetical protein